MFDIFGSSANASGSAGMGGISGLLGILGAGLAGASKGGTSQVAQWLAQQQQQAEQTQRENALRAQFAPPQPNQVSVTPMVSGNANAGVLPDSQQTAQQRQLAQVMNAQPMTTPGQYYGTTMQPLLPLLLMLTHRS